MRSDKFQSRLKTRYLPTAFDSGEKATRLRAGVSRIWLRWIGRDFHDDQRRELGASTVVAMPRMCEPGEPMWLAPERKREFRGKLAKQNRPALEG
jgi:hypothetical protein